MIKGLGTTFGIAGVSVGMGLIGEELGSAGLIEGGAVAGQFISPAVSISSGGLIINMLKEDNNDVSEYDGALSYYMFIDDINKNAEAELKKTLGGIKVTQVDDSNKILPYMNEGFKTGKWKQK